MYNLVGIFISGTYMTIPCEVCDKDPCILAHTCITTEFYVTMYKEGYEIYIYNVRAICVM